jgi:hypothetical protein
VLLTADEAFTNDQAYFTMIIKIEEAVYN